MSVVSSTAEIPRWQDDPLAPCLGRDNGFGDEGKAPSTVQDLQDFYYERLTQAHTDRKIVPQLLYLERLGELFLQQQNYKQSLYFFNGALALAEKYTLPAEHRDFLFKKLEAVESAFLHSFVTVPIACPAGSISRYRGRITEIRKWAHERIDDGYESNLIKGSQAVDIRKRRVFREDAADVVSKITQKYKELLETMILDCIQVMGPPPTPQYACIGMGSMARNEMGPYSDIEFAVLIWTVNDTVMSYFRFLSQFMELKIINLGETPVSLLKGVGSFTPKGFGLDTSGNTPLGLPGIYELIGTPQRLSAFQSTWDESNITLTNALSQVCKITGDDALVEEYQQAMRARWEQTGETLAGAIMEGVIREFKPDLSEKKERLRAFGVKQELYRPFHTILGCLRIFYRLKANTTMGCIEELAGMLVLNQEGAESLKKAFRLVLRLRVQAHLFYQSEQEILYHPKGTETEEEKLFEITQAIADEIAAVYKVLIPFFTAAKNFFINKKLDSFSGELFTYCLEQEPQAEVEELSIGSWKSPFEEAVQQQLFLNPNDEENLIVKEVVQQQLSLNPNDEENLIHRAKIAEDPREKVDYANQAIKQIVAIYGDDPMIKRTLSSSSIQVKENKPLFEALVQLGLGYLGTKEYEEAVNAFEKALTLCERIMRPYQFTPTSLFPEGVSANIVYGSEHLVLRPDLLFVLDSFFDACRKCKKETLARNVLKKIAPLMQDDQMASMHNERIGLNEHLITVSKLIEMDPLVAENYFLKFRDAFRDLSNELKKNLFVVLHNLGFVFKERGNRKMCDAQEANGDIQKAIEYLQQSFEVFQALAPADQKEDLRLSVCHTLSNLMECCASLDEGKQVNLWYDKLTEIIRRKPKQQWPVDELTKIYYYMISFWNKYGVVHEHNGKFCDAEMCYRNAFLACRELGRRPSNALATILINLGSVLEIQGEDFAANTCYIQAFPIVEALGDASLYLRCVEIIRSSWERENAREIHKYLEENVPERLFL